MNYQDKLNSLASNLIIERKAEPVPEPIQKVFPESYLAQKHPSLFKIKQSNYALWQSTGKGSPITADKILKAMEVLKNGKL